MAYQQFCGVVEIALDGLRKLGVDNPGLDLVVVNLQLVGKNFGEPVGVGVALAEYVVFAGGNAYFHGSDAGSVLPAVMLLFH